VASHRDLHGLLVDAGLDAQTAHADVRALHDGRVVVLIRTDRSSDDVLAALEEVPA
jgi:hypothetical protein